MSTELYPFPQIKFTRKEWSSSNINLKRIELCSLVLIKESSGREQRRGIKTLQRLITDLV
jgi:hypothetical protein